MQELSTIHYVIIFLVIILGYIGISCMAAAMEGRKGGIFGKKRLFGLSADAWIFFVMIPLFLSVTFIVNGIESKLLGTVLLGIIIGMILEDFFWFVVNPNYGVSKFNSTDAPWLSWLNLNLFEIPLFYLCGIVFAALVFILFIKNADAVNLFLRNFLH